MYIALFRKQYMLDSTISYIINIRNPLCFRKLSAGLALGCCLNILVRGKMIHYNYYLFRIFHLCTLDFRELTDRYRGSQVISENQIQGYLNQISRLYSVYDEVLRLLYLP